MLVPNMAIPDHPMRPLTGNAYAEKLYLQYQSLWYRVAFQIVHDPDDAKDIVQDAYRKFLGTQREWPSFEDAKRYFSTIVTNTAIDYFKMSRRREEKLSAADPDSNSSMPGQYDGGRPWDALERSREERLLKESIHCIQTLPPPQKEAVQRLLLDEGNKTLSQISRELGIPISTLKSRSILGIKKVRKKLRRKRLL